ncbi:DUF3857 domain-containing protein [Nonlabens xiamenensis]|uniref:DUF3857 domain-containing protein n=1 Tax=Nonlabens xiamenensis TaxID=2341043 RepID=UPI000F6153B2|nr:DUF3857 domain-containing protein [Nonlabens xiamenensis]
MHRIIYISLLFSLVVQLNYAQDQAELEAEFWKMSPDEMIALSIPQQWNDESAIILEDDSYIRYINSGRRVYITRSKHQVVKIQDQASLEDFSEIRLSKDSRQGFMWRTFSKKETFLGIRLIKPDATIVKVDISQEEVLEDETRKIAIPNLEIGDIVDLFIFSEEKQTDASGFELYDPIETTLKDDYPILSYKLAVEVENDFFLNMNSYNGAPPVKEIPTDRNATKKYAVEASHLERLDARRWYYPLIEEPSVKFQVCFARSRGNETFSPIFKGEDGERKAIVTKQDVLDFYDRKFGRADDDLVRSALKYLKENNITDQEQKFHKALEWLRFYGNTKYYEGIFAYQSDLIGAYPNPRCNHLYYGRYSEAKEVIDFLRVLCEKLDVDYDILMAQPRYDGAIEDMLIKANARVGIRINTPSPLYFFTYNENMKLNQNMASLEGAEVYVGKVVKGKKITDITIETLPTSSPEDNVYTEDIELSLTASNDIALERTMTASGQFLQDYIYSWISWVDFLKEDYERFDSTHFYDCGSKREKRENPPKFKALEDETVKEYKENRKTSVEKEWDAKIEDYDNAYISSGRYEEEAPLSISENYVIKEKFVKKAGPNLILEIGKFIGGQVEIEEEERTRKVDIYIDHPKTYTYDITFTIPEGYTLKGVEKLNQSIENETGAFKVTAQSDGKQLKVQSTKIYKKNYLPVTQWKDMLPWLDAAFEFNQAKVLLQKV